MDNATRRQILERVKQLGYPNTLEALQNPQVLDQYEQQLQAQSQQQQPIQQPQPVTFPTPPATTPNYKVPQPRQSEAKPLVMSFNETAPQLMKNGGPKDKGWREYKTPAGESLYLDPRFKDQRYYVNEKGDHITPNQNMSLFDVQDNIWESGTSMAPLEIKSDSVNYSSTSDSTKKNYQSNLKNSSYKQDREYLKPDDINWYETLNYKKWGLKDYSNYSSFNSAFRNAKESGEKEFVWNDERYNTNLAPKEVSDNYHDSKKFLQEYYANEPFFTLDTSMYGKLSAWRDYTKNKYGTTWGDYYDKVSGTPEYKNSDNPKYDKIQDTLDMLDEPMYYSRFPQEAKDYYSKSIRDKYLKSLNDPSYYFSITSQPDPNEPVLGYQDAGNKAFYVSNTNTPGKFNTTSVHELSHKADTEDRIAYKNENSRIPKVNIDDLNKYGSSLSQERFNYVSEPTEIEARKMSTLYYLNKAKKVNVKSGKITEDQLDALYKEAGHYRDTDSKVPDDVKDLLELYKYQKTDLLKYLNNDFNYTKKYGGKKCYTCNSSKLKVLYNKANYKK
jgi:hypothetical protein